MKHMEIKTMSPVLVLLDKYTVTSEQRQIIMETATKTPEYQQWFLDQFTRNR